MITLAASDTLAGGADAATKINVTICGIELNGATEAAGVPQFWTGNAAGLGGPGN